MKVLLTLILLLAFLSSHAGVVCSNNNPMMSETTPSEDFTDNGDGTVTHIKTGLTWMKCVVGMKWETVDHYCSGLNYHFDWQEALQIAQNINTGLSDADRDGEIGFAGHTDWRLPNRNELMSIVEYSCWSPSINEDIFNHGSSTLTNEYWTSSPATTTVDRWAVNFYNGIVLRMGYGNSIPIRLVRAGDE